MTSDNGMFEPDQAPPPSPLEDALNLDNWTEVTPPAWDGDPSLDPALWEHIKQDYDSGDPAVVALFEHPPIHSQATPVPDVGAEFMRRLFEPLPYEHRVMYRPGDVVKHSRPDLWGSIPLNAEGVVVSLEHPESVMASKGRDYLVKFDLTPFKIPVDPAIISMLQRAGVAPDAIPEYMGEVTQNMSYNDLSGIRHGAAWADPNYQYPYETDHTTFTIWCKGVANGIYERISAQVDAELDRIKAANSNGSN